MEPMDRLAETSLEIIKGIIRRNGYSKWAVCGPRAQHARHDLFGSGGFTYQLVVHIGPSHGQGPATVTFRATGADWPLIATNVRGRQVDVSEDNVEEEVINILETAKEMWVY